MADKLYIPNNRDPEAGYMGFETFDDFDFTGAANIFLTEADYTALKALGPDQVDTSIVNTFFTEGFLDLDLIIENVSFQYADHQKLEEEIGDTFSIHFHGKAPIILQVSGRLFDLSGNGAKHALVSLYRDVFRLSKVAKYKLIPNIEFIGCIASGALLNLIINENSASSDTLSINFQYLLNSLSFHSPDNPGRIQYTTIAFDRNSALDKTTVRSTRWPSVG